MGVAKSGVLEFENIRKAVLFVCIKIQKALCLVGVRYSEFNFGEQNLEPMYEQLF
jgi:hypothetical protein